MMTGTAVHRHPRLHAGPTAVLVVAGLALFAACSSSKAPATSTSTSAPAATTATTATPAAGKQTITVTPSTGLSNHQTVHVVARGFKANESGLVVSECADKGSATGQADCNLSGIVLTNANASGEVDTTLTVLKGPFGANKIVCGASQKCEVSVTQATPNPTEQASEDISFAS